MPELHPIVAELAAIRRRQEKSVDLLAGFTGLHRRTIYHLETGSHGARLDTASRIAAALGYQLALMPIKNGTRP